MSVKNYNVAEHQLLLDGIIKLKPNGKYFKNQWEEIKKEMQSTREAKTLFEHFQTMVSSVRSCNGNFTWKEKGSSKSRSFI